MIKFGTIKSKIEQKLLESYNTNSFKKEIGSFKDMILKNKDLSKLYYFYNELNTPKGLSESEAKDFLSESISMIKSLVIDESKIKKIKSWVSGIKIENQYKHIDDLISEGINVKNILSAKKTIINVLCEEVKDLSPKATVPLKSMVSIANQTLSTYLESLDDSDKKEIQNIIKMKDSDVKEKFLSLKEDVVSKLKSHLNETKEENEKSKITETINIINNKSADKIEYFKLKSLYQSL